MKNVNTQDSQNNTKPWILLALLITVGLVLWTALQEDAAIETNLVVPIKDGSSVVNRAESLKVQKQIQTENNDEHKESLIDWEKLNRTNLALRSENLFKVHSWVVAPPAPKPVKPQPAPPPTAPPVPFNYMGRLDNSPKGNLIYLATTDKSYSVVIGNKVDSFWHLDSEDAQNLYFTYLPLNLPQVLGKNQRAIAPEPTQAVVNAFQ